MSEKIVFDHLLQRNEKISKALRGEKESEPSENDVDVAPEADSQTGEDKDNVPSLDDAVKELNGKLTGEPEAAPSEHFSPQSKSLPPVEECRVHREPDC